MRWLLYCAALILIGCSVKPDQPVLKGIASPAPPQVIYKKAQPEFYVVMKPVEISRDYFKKCPTPTLSTYTIADLNRVIKQMVAVIDQCNKDKLEIRKKIDASN